MSEQKPLVSILIPAYNVGSYIGKCLESVLAQTYGNIQVVVVNDGSTDNTAKIIEKYAKKDGRIVVCNKKNEGVMCTRKDTILLAQGEYFFFIDSDDYISPNCIEKMMQVVINGDYDIVSAPLIRVKNNYSSLLKQFVPEKTEGYGYLQILLEHRIFTSLAGKIYRKTLFADVIFEKSISLWDDFFLNIQVALKQPKCNFMDEGFYYYIQRGSSLNRSSDDADYLENFINILDSLFDKYPDIKNRYSLEIIQDKIHWFYIYIKKSHNKWIGDTELARSIIKSVKENEDKLQDKVSMVKLNSILLYERKILHPLVLFLGSIDRIRQSTMRRINSGNKDI